MVRLQAARRGQVVRELVRSETAAATTVQAALRGRHSRREHGASAYWANGEGVPARAGDTTPEDGVCRGCDRWVRECSCGRTPPRAEAAHAAEVKRRRANASRSRSPSPSKATVSGASTPKRPTKRRRRCRRRARRARRLRREEELQRRGVKSPEHLRADARAARRAQPSRPNPRPTRRPPSRPRRPKCGDRRSRSPTTPATARRGHG